MEKRQVIEQFIYSLQRINRYIRSGIFEQVHPTITRVQWLILRHLHRQGESTVGQLAKRFDVRSSTMSQMIDRLEKVKLVFRATDSADARTRVVRLTDEGLITIKQAEAYWVEALSGPFEELTLQEHEILVRLLTKLANSIPKSGGDKNE